MCPCRYVAILLVALLAILSHFAVTTAVSVDFSVLRPKQIGSSEHRNASILKNSNIEIVASCWGQSPTEWVAVTNADRAMTDTHNQLSYSNIWTQWVGPEWAGPQDENEVGRNFTYTYITWLRVGFGKVFEEEKLLCRSVVNASENVAVSLTPVTGSDSVLVIVEGQLKSSQIPSSSSQEDDDDDVPPEKLPRTRQGPERCRVQFELLSLPVAPIAAHNTSPPVQCASGKPLPVKATDLKKLFICYAVFYCEDNYRGTGMSVTIFPKSCSLVARTLSTRAALPTLYDEWKEARSKSGRKTATPLCGPSRDDGESPAAVASKIAFFTKDSFPGVPREFSVREIAMIDDVIWLEMYTDSSISANGAKNYSALEPRMTYTSQTLQTRCLTSKYPFAHYRQFVISLNKTKLIGFDGDLMATQEDPEVYGSKNVTINLVEHGPGSYTLECVAVPWNNAQAQEYKTTATIQVRGAVPPFFELRQETAETPPESGSSGTTHVLSSHLIVMAALNNLILLFVN